MVAHRKWTDDQLVRAVAESVTVAEVHRRLGLRLSGTSPAHLARHVERLALDTCHFKGQGWSRGNQKNPDEVATALLPLLRRGNRVAQLRDRLIASGLKKAVCEECGLKEWRGKAMPLQVDHRDGDRLNNELINLRILCANCHAQTETSGFKNARRRPEHARWWNW